jgi:protein-S-isoprenylcysteine O-methyltransferase Ste14
VLFGESIAILSLKIMIWTGLFSLFDQIYFLVYEEPTFEKRFGEEYRSYKSRVPRWIPNLKAYKQGKESGNNL